MNNILGHLFAHYIQPPYGVSQKLHNLSLSINKYIINIPDYRTKYLLNRLSKQLKLEYNSYELYNLTELNLNSRNLNSLPEEIGVLKNLQ